MMYYWCVCVCARTWLKLFSAIILNLIILGISLFFHYVWQTNISVKYETLLHVCLKSYLYSVELIGSMTIITFHFSEAKREIFSSSFVPFSHLVGLSGKKHPHTQICFSVTFRSETFFRAWTIRLAQQPASVGSRLANEPHFPMLCWATAEVTVERECSKLQSFCHFILVWLFNNILGCPSTFAFVPFSLDFKWS